MTLETGFMKCIRDTAPCPLVSTFHVQPIVRQGFQPLPQSESPLKRTNEFFSPLKRTFAIRQGIHSLADLGSAVSLRGSIESLLHKPAICCIKIHQPRVQLNPESSQIETYSPNP